MRSRALPALGKAVAAVQLFAGETRLRQGKGRRYRHSTAERDDAREEVIRDIAFGDGTGDRYADAARRKDMVFRLVKARQRERLWEESCLDRLCSACMDASQSRTARREPALPDGSSWSKVR